MGGTNGNFLPNIKCPHCGKSIVTSLSGFSSELAIREKFCNKCNKPYFLQVFVTTSLNKSIEDGKINGVKRAIMSLKERRKLTYIELLITYEQAREINTEALKIARKMRRKRNMN